MGWIPVIFFCEIQGLTRRTMNRVSSPITKWKLFQQDGMFSLCRLTGLALQEPNRLEICFPVFKLSRFSLEACAALAAGDFALNSPTASWEIHSNQNFGYITEKRANSSVSCLPV